MTACIITGMKVRRRAMRSSVTNMHLKWIWLSLFIALLPAPVFSGNGYHGKSLEEALRELQLKGLKIIYSSKLVLPEMKVTAEPQSSEPSRLIKELLYPHNLNIRSGPSGTLLVVRAKRSELPGKDAAPAGPVVQPPQEYVVVPFATVSVSARDDAGNFVTNLTASDFVLKENGQEQKIVEFVNSSKVVQEPAPSPLMNHSLSLPVESTLTGESRDSISYILLLDSSASMNRSFHEKTTRIDMVRALADHLLLQMEQGDSAMLLEFSESTRGLRETSSDVPYLRAGLQEYRSGRTRTALYDAIISAVEQARDLPGRRILLLCSDGEDNASKTTLKELIPILQSSGVTVFTVATVLKTNATRAGRMVLEEISRVTGGLTFFPSEEEAVLVDHVTRAISSQYMLGYYIPFSRTHGWRNVEILCKVPGITLRYRPTYLF